MKKNLFCWVLIIVLLVSCQIAHADDTFSIRNGIQFGMSMEEVCNAERAYGTSIDGAISGPEESDYNPTEYMQLVKYTYVTLMDYPQSVLSYYFDSNGELMSIGYVFGIGSKNPPSYSAVFSEMKELLINKYGTPYNENEFLSGDLATSMLSDDIYTCSLLQSVGMGANFYDLNQWIVEYSDYYVLIDLYNLKLFSSTHTYLGYRILSPEEFSTALQVIDTENESQEARRQQDI